jgi:putative ABC transport system permease protein
MTGVGAILGLGLSVATSALVRSALMGVEGLNPWVLVGVVGTIGATSVAASLLPGLRAIRIDPLVAFREE